MLFVILSIVIHEVPFHPSTNKASDAPVPCPFIQKLSVLGVPPIVEVSTISPVASNRIDGEDAP